MWLKEKRKEWFGLLFFLNLGFLFLFLLLFFLISLKLVLVGFFPEEVLMNGARPYSMLELGESYHGGPVYQLWLEELSKPIPRKNRFQLPEKDGFFSEELVPYLGHRFSKLEREKEVEKLLQIAVTSRTFGEMEKKIEDWYLSYLDEPLREDLCSSEGWSLSGERVKDLSLNQYLRLRQLNEWRWKFLLEMDLPGMEVERGSWKKRKVVSALSESGYQGLDRVQTLMNLWMFRHWYALVLFRIEDPLYTLHTYDLFAPRLKDRISFIKKEFPSYLDVAKEDPRLVFTRWVGAPSFFLEQYRRSWVDRTYVKPTSYMEELEDYMEKVRYRVLDYYLERAERKYFYQLNRMIPDLYKFDGKVKHRFGHPQVTWLRRLKRYRMAELLYDYGVRSRERRNYKGWRFQPKRTKSGKVVRDAKGKMKITIKKYATFIPAKNDGVTVVGKHRASFKGVFHDPRIYLRQLISKQGKEKLAKGKHYYLFHHWGERSFLDFPSVSWWWMQEKDLVDRGRTLHPVYGYLNFYQRLHMVLALKHRRMSGREQNSFFPRTWVNYDSPYALSYHLMKDYLPSSYWHWDRQTNRMFRGSFQLGARKWARWKDLRGKKNVKEVQWMLQGSGNSYFPWYSKKWRGTQYAGGYVMRETYGAWLKKIMKPFYFGQENFFSKENWMTDYPKKIAIMDGNWKRMSWFGTPSNLSFESRLRLMQWFRHVESSERKQKGAWSIETHPGWGTVYQVPGCKNWTLWNYLNYLFTGWWVETHLRTYLVMVSSVWFSFFWAVSIGLVSSAWFWLVWGFFLFVFFLSTFWLAGQSENWLKSKSSSFWSSMEKEELIYLFWKTFYRWKGMEWNGISSSWVQSNWYWVDHSYYLVYGKSVVDFGQDLEVPLTYSVVRVFFWLGCMNFLVGLGLFFFCWMVGV